jgi:hypothetical protein
MRESCAPPRTTEAPYPKGDTSLQMSTYTSSYGSLKAWHAPPKPFRQIPQHSWGASDAKFTYKSTSQEAFQGLQGAGRRSSCAPPREYAPMKFDVRPMTTNEQMFQHHFSVQKRESFRPKRPEVEKTKFETRSTAQDAFPAHYGFVAAKPIYPAEKPRELVPLQTETTSRSFFIAHKVTPFRQHAGPKTALGKEGSLN